VRSGHKVCVPSRSFFRFPALGFAPRWIIIAQGSLTVTDYPDSKAHFNS
jgi:hypothetical protein